jgi:hypothetical protein
MANHTRRTWALIAAFGLTVAANAQSAQKYCSATASRAFEACKTARREEYQSATAVCGNVSDPAARDACIGEAKDARSEATQLCRDQLSARRDVCKDLGEARYADNLDPALFDSDFGALTHPNPYFPLGIGHSWKYQSGSETDVVEILDATKAISGVTCVVARDVVREGSDVVEDTNDWYAQAKNGDVHYCGEEAKQLESFDGDDPRVPEVVGIEGSFKAGRDGAQSGILAFGAPTVGTLYRQEFMLGVAEDVARILSTTYSFGGDVALDAHVPQALADHLCAGDCIVTEDFSPLEPGVLERKYYAPGIGVFLEVTPDTGEVLQLVDCNFDARCDTLPSP